MGDRSQIGSPESMDQSVDEGSSRSPSSGCPTPVQRYPSIEDYRRLEEENRQLRQTIKELRQEMKEERARAEERHQQLLERFERQQDRAPSVQKSSVVPPAKSPARVDTPAPVVKPAASAAKATTSAGRTAAPAGPSTGAGAATDTANPQVSKRKKPFSGNTSEEETDERTKQARRERTPEPRPAAKEARIPPVILRGKETWTKIAALLKRERIAYTKAKLTAEGVAVTPATAADHRRMTRVLTEERQEYHTYSLAEDRLLRVVVRGIPSEIDPQEVRDDLRSQGFHPTTVNRMLNRRTKTTLPLMLVQVPLDEEKILDTNRCCGLVVRVERQKALQVATQCHRCQRFGHGQGRCTAQPKCVKCGEAHETKDCKKSREAPAKCANCQGPHPASYRGCPKFPKAAATKRTAVARKTATQAPAVSQVTPPAGAQGRSYAEAARPKRAQAHAPVGSTDLTDGVGLESLTSELAKAQQVCAALTAFVAKLSPLLQVHG